MFTPSCAQRLFVFLPAPQIEFHPRRWLAVLWTVVLVVLAGTSSKASTIVVPAGGDLQGAISAAACGDDIAVQAGATFSGNFVLKYKGACTGTDADYITIHTSNLTALPAAGSRVTPNDAAAMTKLVANSAAPVLEAEANAHHYKLVGLEITNVGGSVVTPELILLGARSSGGSIPFSQHPNHLTFDRCWIHEATNDTSTPDSVTTTAIRGFNLDATDVRITESRIAGFRSYKPVPQGVEASNAILFPTSALRVTVSNTYLEAWFVPVFFGGSGGSSPNTATVTNASLTRATLSSVSNLAIGDLIAFKVTNGRQPAGATCSNCSVAFQVARVTAINGNVVDYVGQYNYGGTGTGGNPLLQVPDSPGLAQWNGYTNQDILIQRCQFVSNFNSTEYVWTHTGGSPTTLPRSQQTSTGNAPKGQIEIKMARNLTIDGNSFEGWHSGITLTSRNQGNTQTSGGFPWASVENLRITNNWWKRTANWNRIYSILIGGPQLEDNEYTSKRGGPVLISNNLFDTGVNELLAAFSGADNVTVTHNTYAGSSTSPGGSSINGIGVNQAFVLKDNIIPNNEYGIQNCQATSACWPNKVQLNNVIMDNRSNDGKIGDGPLNYPNNFVATQAVGWVDPANANYRLSASSPYKGRASDGKDPGVDMDALLLALSSGSPTPTPTPTPVPSVSPIPTPTPTPTPTPGGGMTSPVSVSRAKDHAAALAGQMGEPSFSHHASKPNSTSPASLSSDLDALTNDILSAYNDFNAERNLFTAPTAIETQLTAALLFSRANAAVALKTGNTSGVAAHLERIVCHLTMTEDLMLYGSISQMTADRATAARTRINITIGYGTVGYLQEAAGPIAPASLGSVFDSMTEPFCLQPAYASSSTAMAYEVGGVTVSVGGHAAPVVYVSPTRLAFVVPDDVPMGSAELIIASQDGYVSRGLTTISRSVFHLMTANDDGTGEALALNLTKSTHGFDVITPENIGPDKRTRVALFAVGVSGSSINTNTTNDLTLGNTTIVNLAESVSVEARKTNGTVVTLPVEFAGAANQMHGLDQVNVRLTPELSGAGVVQLTMIVGGLRSNSAPIYVR
ncbi:MAG TPA: hypothetical protein VLL54_12230 [Pyrinomonadaceae bacterium]|nr:hypothetical protein [Pyrinomonadaceae bacterium]